MAHFLFVGMGKPGRIDLKALILPIVEGLGVEWVGLQVLSQGRDHSLLRVFVDKLGGLSMQDCVSLTRQIKGLLGVQCPTMPYSLEVSSPGLDRLFFSAEQCLPYCGRTIVLKLVAERAGTRHFRGCLEAVEGQMIRLRIAEEVMDFDFAGIKEARLVPESRGA